MPAFGALAPFGLLEFGAYPTIAENFYTAMTASVRKAFDVSEGTHADASCYARAIAFAAVKATVRHGWSQRRPARAREMLPALEKRFGLSPLPRATEQERRDALIARKRVQYGSRREAIEGAMEAHLGDAFQAVLTVPDLDLETYGTGHGTYNRLDLPHRSFKTLGSVAVTGSAVAIPYAPLSIGADEIQVGDVLSIDAQDWAREESITVSAVDNDADPKTFTATFTALHPADARVLSHCVVDISTQRSVMVVADADSARDGPTRKRVFHTLHQIVRAVTKPYFVESSGVNTAGPFTLGESPLGCVPVGVVTW